MAEFKGVFPVFDIKFKINTSKTGTPELKEIADMETFSISIDGNVEEWTPMETEGWVKRLATGKGFSIALNGKRTVGDAGNDFINSLAFKTGLDLSTNAEIEFPDGAKLEFDCIVNVTEFVGGDSINVAPLEFELLSNGKPTFTPGA